ncbi:sugar transferase [Clostridium perfringens]|uniref:sugar transferase n=1 Tax=Clostridium perfringens TaxID=1502 RepID=UPI001E63B97D|nr:sugar transferase [Clostridium perfringens]MCC5422167.1 sugar transferase [Clostridium perfringens]MCC5431798.1 sugar transferase [Clostridium perfringens]WVL75778.1 sugar transferase [Clostridium perfringens]
MQFVKENYYIDKNKKNFFVIRLIDILISLVGLIIGLPIIIIFSMFIIMETKDNPIYSQMRVGLENKEFKMYKLRSMVANAEKNGAKWAEKNDPRITKVGRIIRKTRIDEIPQLFNVLKGDMSIIGPRPEREIFYKEFEKKIPNFRERLLIKPGLTGYAQVNGGYDIKPIEKLNLDLYYIRNKSLKLDLIIIIKTFKILVTGEGAR